MGRKKTIVLLGFQTLSLHVPQNQQLIKVMFGRSFPVTSKRIGAGQIQCMFEEENTTEHSPSRLWSKKLSVAVKPGD